MKKQLFQSPLLAAALGLLLGSCGGDGSPLVQTPEDPETRTFTFEISIPSSDKLTVSDGYTRAVGDIVPDMADECAVKTVDIYAFSRNATSTNEDDYKYFDKRSFSVSNGLDGTANASDGNLDGTLDGSSSIKCSIDIISGEELTDKQLRFVLIANETTVSDLTTTSTLTDFRERLASAQLTQTDDTDTEEDGTQAQCEKLVGIADSNNTWFPMSAEVETSGALNRTGENFNVKLVRNVARIDIENNTPNLVITDLKLRGANSSSRILSSDGKGGFNVPQSPDTVTLLPLKSAFSVDNPFAYVIPTEEDGTPTTSEDKLRDANTKTCFYLYEQNNTEDSHVSLEVTYRLTYLEGEVYQEKTLKVPFKSSDAYIDVKRNTRYRVVIGDGREVKTTVANVTIESADWTGHRLDHQIAIENKTTKN